MEILILRQLNKMFTIRLFLCLVYHFSKPLTPYFRKRFAGHFVLFNGSLKNKLNRLLNKKNKAINYTAILWLYHIVVSQLLSYGRENENNKMTMCT